MSEYLSVREGADLLGCHPESLRRWARRGHLRCFRCGSRLRFQRADLIAWLSGKEA